MALNSESARRRKKKPDGEGNYIWIEAAGRGHFRESPCRAAEYMTMVGGSYDMFFIAGDPRRFHQRNCFEDYFLGALILEEARFLTRPFRPRPLGEERAGGLLIRLPLFISISPSFFSNLARHHRTVTPTTAPTIIFRGLLLQSEPHGPVFPLSSLSTIASQNSSPSEARAMRRNPSLNKAEG